MLNYSTEGQGVMGYSNYFEIVTNWDPFLNVPLIYLLNSLHFFSFYEMGPSSKDFFTKIGLISKDFW